MKKTEDILERLKGQMPQVPDGDLLTENIMQAITGAAAAKPGRIVPLWLNVLRVVSSVAAVFLIALLIGLKGPDAELSRMLLLLTMLSRYIGLLQPMSILPSGLWKPVVKREKQDK